MYLQPNTQPQFIITVLATLFCAAIGSNVQHVNPILLCQFSRNNIRKALKDGQSIDLERPF